MSTENEVVYGEWKLSKMGIWINTRTGQESCFHPEAMAIGNVVHDAWKRFTKNVPLTKKKKNRR